MLKKARIIKLFEELNDELEKAQIHGDVFVVGGAAMTVAYDARPSTRDVDAIFQPSSEIRDAAIRVSKNHNDLPEDWLNDGVKGFLPGKDVGEQKVIFDGPNLSVLAASPEYLLAMKLLASRVSRDEDDILLLCEMCGVEKVEQGLDIVTRYFGKRPIEAKVKFMLEELLQNKK